MEQTNRMIQNGLESRALAAESMVLLRNTGNTLPLLGSPEEPVHLAVFGVGQIYTVKGGTGSGNVNNLRTVSLLEGLEQTASLAVDPELARAYRSWGLGHENLCVEGFMEPKGYFNPEMPLTETQVKDCAARNDAAVMILSRVAGEGADMRAEPGMLYLTEEEKTLIDRITGAFPRSILLLNTAGYLEIGDCAGKFSAVVFMGLPGQDAGAVADVLTGAVMPAGRLTDTWPLRYDQYPTAGEFSQRHPNGNVNFSMGKEEEQIDVRYPDDIFVGYRYFDTFGEEVLYPFGFGLDYGKTELTAFSLAVTGGEVSVTVRVENTGEIYPARQVVQVYLSAPSGRLEQPLQRLAAFGKTRLLAPGEEETLTLRFHLRDLAAYDRENHRYVLEKGHYYIRVGVSSRNTNVAGALYLPESVTTEVLSDRMGHVPEDFQTLSARDAVPFTYPGEDEELAFARSHAVRLSPRDFKARHKKYAPEPEIIPRTLEGVTLENVRAGEATLRELVGSMDASDLCALCCGVGMDLSGMPEGLREDPDFHPPFDGMIGSGGMKVPGAAGETADLREKYGIPPLSLADGPAGIRITREIKNDAGEVVRQQLCTAFPVGSLLACSWDPELLARFGRAVAKEMLEYGVDVWLAPGMNIHRDPLCGRNFEYFSEDPLIAGKCAAAVTRGVQKSGVGVTVKHFAANNQETLRANSNDIVTQRALREIYLRGFEIAVKEGRPFCVMTSYNDINGMPSANNYDLTTAILRDEWGFDGFVMTDWGGGISRPALSVICGNDMIQPGGPGVVEELAAALASEEPAENRGLRPFSGKLTLAHLQQAALHILGVVLRVRPVSRI